MNDWQFRIGAVTLGPGTACTITGIDGLPGKDEQRIVDVGRPLGHGYDQTSDLVGSRHVILEIYIDGLGDPTATKALIDGIVGEWFIADTDTEPEKPLVFKFPGSPTQEIHGRPRKSTAPLDLLKSGKGRATLEYVAGDPFIYSNALHSEALMLQQIGGGRTYPRVYPRTYGAGTAPSTPLANVGTLAAAPLARFLGPCTNPVLENTDTGEFLGVNLELGPDDFLDVDFAAYTVLLNGVVSRYLDRDPASSWFRLAKAANTTVRFRADGFAPGASCVVSWRDTWL